MQSSDLGLLLTLDALLQESSVSGAGRRLGLSTPAVSHALAKLRDRLGDPLLVRAGRSMVLTPRAEALRPRVHQAVQVAGRVFEPPEDFDPRAQTRSFALIASDYVMSVFGPALDAQLQASPRVDLRITPNTTGDADALREGSADLAIGIYARLPPELKTRPWIRERLVSVLRQGHPALEGRMTLSRFAQLEHVQVAPRGRPGGMLDTMLSERGHPRRVSRAVPFFSTALELVQRSDRILTLPARLAEQRAETLGLTVFEPPVALPPYTLSLVWHPRNDADPGHRWLRERLVAVADSVS